MMFLDEDAHGGYVVSPREAAFLEQTISLARECGWRWFHDYATNRVRFCPRCHAKIPGLRNPRGLPDLILVRGPQVLWAELKSNRGATTTDQAAWLADLARAGQATRLWRPRDQEEIARTLALPC